MHFLVPSILLLILALFPSMWVRSVIRKHASQRDDIPGTGGELATHLLKQYELYDVTVEETQEGRDHYDIIDKCVRLSPSVHNGKSLTAVAIAAHEVGHAIQFGRNEVTLHISKKPAF